MRDKVIAALISTVVFELLKNSAIKATKYISDKEVITATRKTFREKIRKGNIEIVLKIGRPNYFEKGFIRACKKAEEPFPIKKIQLKFPSRKKEKIYTVEYINGKRQTRSCLK